MATTVRDGVVSVRLESEMVGQFDQLAAEMDRSCSFLIARVAAVSLSVGGLTGSAEGRRMGGLLTDQPELGRALPFGGASRVCRGLLRRT